jgi:hydrogenase maturation protein HypF
MAALDTIKVHCFVNDEQETLLRSSAAPIVLLKKKAESTLPDNVAPLQNYLGFMLPYTPIHHMLLHLLPPSFILVMTSANVHGEVIYYENSDI